MSIMDRHRQDVLDQTAAGYMRGELSRRAFLQHALATSLTIGSTTAFLTACNAENTRPINTSATSIDVLNLWKAEEQASFRAVVAPFIGKTKITINIEATRDLDAVLTNRLRSNNPPDIAILPNPGKMVQLASQNKLIRLDTFLDMNKIHNDYSSFWINHGSYNGALYALFYKTTNKATIWYNPTQFRALGAQVPSTWPELIAISNTIARSGKYPWSMGVESAASSGWPASDWIAEIYLNLVGPDMYDLWVEHKIPWTHPSVRNAFHMFGQIVQGKHYIKGAPESILATGYQEASLAPFFSPPRAYMHYLADAAVGYIISQFPHARPGTDFDFFPFPTIDPLYQGTVTAGADLVVAMNDNSAVREFIKYLASAEAQTIWVKRGGFTSANKSVDLNVYPNTVARASARMLTTATTFRFGAGDIMPPTVQQAFWRGALAFINNQRQLDSILNTIEAAAQQAYSSNA